MNYRRFGKVDFNVSALGFGAMRLPRLEGSSVETEIDEKLAIAMMRGAVDGGLNYIDTAYPYHGGQSEVVVGKALKDGYRAKVKLATKSPVFFIKEEGDFDRMLDEQLAKLDVEHIDFYLLHALNTDSFKNVVEKFDLIGKAEKALKAGKIGHLGFSFHDSKQDSFKAIIDAYDKWDFAQIQINYLDTEREPGIAGMRYAAEKGLAIVAMEPLLGGKLAGPPPAVKEAFGAANADRTPVEWALDFLWDMPEISVILSGMSTQQQVDDNMAYAARSSVGMFSDAERKTIQAVQAKFKEIEAIGCTKCEYCMPCPNGIQIPRNFENYNDGVVYGTMDKSKAEYARMTNGGDRFHVKDSHAGACVSCGLCEQNCPQKLPIMELLAKVHSELA